MKLFAAVPYFIATIALTTSLFADNSISDVWPNPASQKNHSNQNLETIVQTTPNLSFLMQALFATDLLGALEDAGPYTFFAPTNTAIGAMSQIQWQDLLKPENKEKLKEIITFHIVPGKILSSQLKTGKVKTLNGKELNITAKGADISVNGASIVQADIIGTNGVIHEINMLLRP